MHDIPFRIRKVEPNLRYSPKIRPMKPENDGFQNQKPTSPSEWPPIFKLNQPFVFRGVFLGEEDPEKKTKDQRPASTTRASMEDCN